MGTSSPEGFNLVKSHNTESLATDISEMNIDHFRECAFKLEYKSYYITEHETEKAFNYLRIVMTKFDANNKNHNHYIILGYIAKLNIEITLLEEREKELKRRWENGEDIYLSIIEIE
jgi:hypothetical protein